MPALWIAGASLIGGALSSSAASDAAGQQVGAANNATAAQRGMFDKTVQLEQPYNDAGVSATQKLSYLLGLSPSAYSSPAPAPAQPDAASPQYDASGHLSFVDWLKQADPMWSNASWEDLSDLQNKGYQQYLNSPGAPRTPAPSIPAASSNVQSGPPAGMDPSQYGSLLKPFDMNDFQMDPGTQFRIKYGQQALQNSQAAQNGVLSGGALKDLIGFNQDYAGLGYQSAFDRYMANKSFTLGSLNDVSNRGQAAAGNTVNSAGQFSSGIANTITGAGNAAAAGTVGSANALSNGISGGANAYFLSNLLNQKQAGTADNPWANPNSTFTNNPIS